MRRTRLGYGQIGDYAGTMAATLSADEEQVGPDELFGGFFLFFCFFLFFSVSHRLRNASSPLGPTWRYFGPVRFACCAPEASSGGAAQWIRCETRAERKHCIDFWRFIAPVASLPVPLQRLSSSSSVAKQAELASISPP